MDTIPVEVARRAVSAIIWLLIIAMLLGRGIHGDQWLRSRAFAGIVVGTIALVCGQLYYEITRNVIFPGR